MTPSTIVVRHLSWCEQRNLRPMYVTTRRRVLALIERTVGAPLEAATEEALSAWAADLIRRDVKAGTRAAYLSHAQAFFQWLVRERLREDDPTIRLVRPRRQKYLPRPIADNDLERAVAGAPVEIRLWLLLAALMGLRACEIAAIAREDVRDDFDPPSLIIVEGKGGKQRVVPLHPAVAAEIAAAAAPSGWLFPHWDRPGHVEPHNVSHRANRYLHSIGVTSTMHQLRHHFATSLYRQSRDLLLTQTMCGHADPRTTAGYAAWASDTAAAAVCALTIPGTTAPASNPLLLRAGP